MTEEDVKCWLNRAYKIDKEINNLMHERDKAFDMATSAVNGVGNEKVQTSKTNATEGKYAAYADYELEIDKRIDELYAIKLEIMRVINRVDNNTYRLLLMLRYICFMTWECIAEEMGYSDKWVREKLHSQALKEAKKIINAKGEEN